MFRAFRQPTSFESVYVDFIHLFTAVRFSSWFWITPIPLQIIDTNVSSFNGNIDGVALFSSIFTHLLHCASDFFLTKIYPFQPGMKSHSLAIVVPCRNQKLETFPTFRTPRFGRLGWAEQVVNAKGTAELFTCHTVGLCGPSNPRCYLWNQSHPPTKRDFFCGASNFGRWPIQRLQYTCKSQWSLLACSTASLNLPQIQNMLVLVIWPMI